MPKDAKLFGCMYVYRLRTYGWLVVGGMYVRLLSGAGECRAESEWKKLRVKVGWLVGWLFLGCVWYCIS
jgi:hypothetical protein